MDHIKIDKQWKRINIYLKNGWKKGLSIDRIDNEGNYIPENCRWATWNIQNANKGKLKNNTSGYVGINWNKKYQLWQIRIHINNKRISLGYSKTKKV